MFFFTKKSLKNIFQNFKISENNIISVKAAKVVRQSVSKRSSNFREGYLTGFIKFSEL
jgi:hypothetical protein